MGCDMQTMQLETYHFITTTSIKVTKQCLYK